MKRMKIIILILLFSLKAFAPSEKVMYILRSQSEISRPYEKIWKAVIAVESGGDPLAVGDMHLKSHSYGVVQIRKVRMDDYNARTGNSYSHSDAFDVGVSKRIFMYYAHRIGPYDTDYLIRKWNGSGKKTYDYLNKVKAKL